MKQVSDSFIQKNKKINQSYRHYEDLQINNSAEIILFLETIHNRNRKKEGIAIFFSTNNRDRKGEILVGVVVPNIIIT